MQIPVLLLNDGLIVCVKPPGLLSERGGLPELLEEQCGGAVFPVHRLDRDVGGVMVYARTREAAAAISKLIAERRMEKEYLAVIEGRPEEERGELRDLLYHDQKRNKSFVVQRPRKGVKEAALRYRLLETAETEQGMLSLLRIQLNTGRSHQIRVQFASRRMPLAGDARYGSHIRAGGIALWSVSLRFPDWRGCGEQAFEALPPRLEPWTHFGLHNF